LTLSPDVENLIRRTREGDVRAYRQLYDLYSKRVLNFCYRLTGSRETAEEVTQETFVSVYRNVGALKDASRFEPWLFMIARNFVYQVYRRKRLPTVSADATDEDNREIVHLEADGGSPEDQMLRGELQQVARQIIQSLAFKYREVFVLAVLEGFSYLEVAEMVGRKVQSVKTDIHRARLMIRERMARYLREGAVEP
jgi:RNA polymerase sigma-70 factor (ECF subfamily)